MPYMASMNTGNTWGGGGGVGGTGGGLSPVWEISSTVYIQIIHIPLQYVYMYISSVNTCISPSTVSVGVNYWVHRQREIPWSKGAYKTVFYTSFQSPLTRSLHSVPYRNISGFSRFQANNESLKEPVCIYLFWKNTVLPPAFEISRSCRITSDLWLSA